MKGLWNDHIIGTLEASIPLETRKTLHTWQCMGQGESFLAEIVESSLSGSELEIGYRARFPYVDVKVWVPARQLEDAKPWLTKTDAALTDYLIGKNKYDLASDFCKALGSKKSIHINDAGTFGKILNRLGPELLKNRIEATCNISSTLNKDTQIKADAVFTIHPIALDGTWSISAKTAADDVFQFIGKSHLRGNEWAERNQVFIAEQAILQWCRWLKKNESVST